MVIAILYKTPSHPLTSNVGRSGQLFASHTQTCIVLVICTSHVRLYSTFTLGQKINCTIVCNFRSSICNHDTVPIWNYSCTDLLRLWSYKSFTCMIKTQPHDVMHLILPRRRTNDFHILEITHNTLGHTPLSQASSSVLLHRHHLYFDFTFFVKKIQKAGYLVKTQHNAFVQAKIQGVLQIFKEFLKQFKDFSRTKAEILKFKEFSRTLPFFKDFSRPVRSM